MTSMEIDSDCINHDCGLATRFVKSDSRICLQAVQMQLHRHLEVSSVSGLAVLFAWCLVPLLQGLAYQLT